MILIFVAEALSNLPASKRHKGDDEINGTVCKHGASHYLPFLSSEDKDTALAKLKFPCTRTDTEIFFDETKIIQRHLVHKSVDWLRKAFPWLDVVRFQIPT